VAATREQRGLTSEQARARLLAHGPNRLPEPKPPNVLLQLLRQFANPLVLTLLVAAAVATAVGLSGYATGSWWVRFGDAGAILIIVVLNALLGFYQERKAETALAALRRLEVPSARVWRDGERVELPADGLVPGDVIALAAGDAVPADARLVDATELAVDESVLTGESVSATRDQGSPLYLGTTVVRGKGCAEVFATGAATELGRVGTLLAGAGQEPTPLEQRLRVFGKRILWACLTVSAALFAWGLARGGRAWHELLLEAVSFAVAAIPEGLPAITTITLALGMQRMARRGAILRKLPAVETLGAATVICSDKTGTLTQNQMTVREVYAGGRRYPVTGEGYAPTGEITGAGPGALDTLLQAAVVCNGARLHHEDGQWKVLGDPTEGALLTLAAKGGQAHDANYPVLREIPFDSERKRMTVVADVGGVRAFMKGSVDVVLARCALAPGEAAIIQAEADRMAAAALRVLAIARSEELGDGDPEAGLRFLGLVGMLDPPRAGVKEAIAACDRAGIRVVMITGDHRLTAMAIARELGLWRDGDEALTGPELAALPPEQLASRIRRVRVFARTTPEQKLRIVQALKASGEIVAMTGDGVNDAPALREAHIGVAMGRSGTDVARQAADMVLTDDNFATLVDAVREGRAIWRNIQKFIFFLLSSNAGLAVAVFGGALSEAWLPLTPLMILWINLVTNGFPALALGIDPADPALMNEPPRPVDASLTGRRDYLGVLYVGGVMGGLALLLYGLHASEPLLARTMAFTLLALSPLAHAASCRSPAGSVFQQRPLVSIPLLVACLVSAGIHLLAILVPGLRAVFRTEALDGHAWLVLAAAAFAVIPAVELAKAISRARAQVLRRRTGSGAEFARQI
jgi:P-type Ca2+ transporter type 2C